MKSCATCLFLCFAAISLAAEPDEPVTGPDFQQQLNRPVLANLDYTPLRRILSLLADDRRIAVCLDRRIDPGQLVFVEIQSDYFDTGIAELVESIPADVVVVAETVFVTTSENARLLRTRIALAEEQLKGIKKADFGRQLDLAQRSPINWERLTTPRSLLEKIAKRYDVTIENAEVIPHDLWPAGHLAHANFIEAISLIASQFSLELKWIDEQRIMLIPQSPDPVIQQDHVFRGRTKSQAAKLLKETFPDLEVKAFRDHLSVTGRVEQQEDVAVLLGNRQPRKPSLAVVNAALANRRFTLQMAERPFLELVEALEKQGIQFDRNAQLLADAGVDLRKPISLKIENATIETLLTEACEPLGLTYEIDDTRIELIPAPVSKPDR